MSAATDNLRIVKTVFLKAPPEHVWKFLTTSAGLAKWFHDAPHDLAEGGEYRVNTNSAGRQGERLCWGEVIEMKPCERLVHTFTHDHLKGRLTTCTWTLQAAGNGTILTLVHEGMPDFDTAAGHDSGWDEHFVRLRRVTS